ncbi:SDR family oxidoreductase [Haloferula chungangensis]|uniref:SDR family oxidoreductase n=1 Tax=Haloferula chungangensis TaxID=1048331 RepID=A0ABW2L968_9BACT
MKSPILITGGATGIGAATARLAAARGHAVAINYRRSEADATALVEEIRQTGGSAVAVQADVSVSADVDRLFDAVERELGPLGALVNNAGVLEKQCRVVDMDAGRLSRVFQTNVIGSFLCCIQAARRMSLTQGGAGGSIVNVSSAAARLGAAGEYVDYAASKGAMDTLTIGLAAEVAAEGIRVNAVRPAFIHTAIHAAGGEPGRIERLTPLIPMRRGGRPEEVATAILWLISEEASYTTGAIIDIAGGK